MPDQQDNQDPVMDQITAAIALSQSGDQDSARQRFAAIWDLIGPDGDPFHRCTLAHHAADVQLAIEDELTWDLRALAAAEELTDERARRHHHSLSVAGFYPSLHLNLADDYKRLGDLTRAREHLAAARSSTGALADDGYGTMIRSGIGRLADELTREALP